MSNLPPDDQFDQADQVDPFDDDGPRSTGTRPAFESPLSQRVRENRANRRRVAALVGVIAIPGLVVVGSTLARPGMENELERNAVVAAKTLGIPGITVRATGQDLTVSGTIASDADRAKLVRILGKVRGVRSVKVGTLTVAGGGSTVTAAAVAILPMSVIYSEGKVTYSGTRPSKAALDALIGTTRQGLGQELVSDNMVVKGHESDDVDVDAYRKLGAAVSQFPVMKVRNATLTLQEGSVDIAGVLAEESQRARVLALLAEVVGDPNRVRDQLSTEAATPNPTVATSGAGTTVAGATPTAPGSTPATTAAGSAPTTVRVLSAVDGQAAVDAIMKQGKISFATNLATLSQGKDLIDKIAGALRGTSLKVEVAGYTDNRGDPAKNQALSQRRADTVRTELIANGLTEAQVTAVGRGSENPIASNVSAAGQALNRRIEFTVSG